jgi:Vitamin B6 photo-protection and homoeostasis
MWRMWTICVWLTTAVILPLLVLPNVSCLAVSNTTPASTRSAVVVVSRRTNGSRQEYSFAGSNNDPAAAIIAVDDDAGSPPGASTSSNVMMMTPPLSPTTKSRPPNKYPGAPQQRLSYWMKSTFLPVGYPASVQPRYLQFSIWNALQDWSTTLRSTLATQRILVGVGVGTSTATAVSAVQNFLIRDAAGMAATLLFTASTSFGANVKQWRIFADIMVDLGITLEVAAIQVPKRYFLLMLCGGNICKAVCGVAAGASGAPLLQYWGNDTADVSAKAGAQRSVVGAIGLIVSAVFAQWSSTARQSHIWLLYIGLTIFHIYANIQCMKTVAFSYFNRERLEKVASVYLDAWSQGKVSSGLLPQLLPTPRQMGQTESLLFLPTKRRTRRQRKIRFGVAFNDLVAKQQDQQSHRVDPLSCRDLLRANGYCCVVAAAGNTSSSSSSSPPPDRVLVALTGDATAYVKTKAYFHALLLQRVLEKIPTSTTTPTTTTTTSGQQQQPQGGGWIAETIAAQEIEPAWDRFVQEASTRGWDVHQSNLPTVGYEVWLTDDDK